MSKLLDSITARRLDRKGLLPYSVSDFSEDLQFTGVGDLYEFTFSMTALVAIDSKYLPVSEGKARARRRFASELYGEIRRLAWQVEQAVNHGDKLMALELLAAIELLTQEGPRSGSHE